MSNSIKTVYLKKFNNPLRRNITQIYGNTCRHKLTQYPEAVRTILYPYEPFQARNEFGV